MPAKPYAANRAGSGRGDKRHDYRDGAASKQNKHPRKRECGYHNGSERCLIKGNSALGGDGQLLPDRHFVEHGLYERDKAEYRCPFRRISQPKSQNFVYFERKRCQEQKKKVCAVSGRTPCIGNHATTVSRTFFRGDGRSERAKILTAYHQYYAVGKALQRTRTAVEGNGKIGVFWHTQGSGKSLSMVFYAHQLVQHLPEVTIVVVTDRKDLDNQLFGQFCRCQDFLRQEPQNAQSREDLGNLLRNRKSGGIIFTTIQKFEEGDSALSTRRNIIVMTDEAHRSQYGDEHWDMKSLTMKKGFSQKMREALPGASFIGFTGTPISDRDRDTEEVFGNYIDVYDMSQAVDDGATRPVYYESRVVNLNLDEDTMNLLNDEFDNLADEGATEEQIRQAKQEHSRLEVLLGGQNDDGVVDADFKEV